MITINTESREPLVEQVCKALKQAVASGALEPGQELPSARQLGGDLDIHWNTVSRAYRQLAEEKVIFVAPGRKAYVREIEVAENGPTQQQLDEVAKLFREGLTQAKLYGMVKNATESIFQNEIVGWNHKGGKKNEF